MRPATVFLLLLACCNNEDEQPLLLRAMIACPPHDTIFLELPAATRHCSDGRTLLLESLSPEGSGVLLRLRYRDTVTSDSFPIMAPGDTAAARGAVLAIRYFIRDTPHGYVLDSGGVHVRRDGSRIEALGEGTGVENGIRIPARVEFRDVPIGSDTVPCHYEP